MYYLRFLFRTEVAHLLSKSNENKLSHRCCYLVFIKITGVTIVFHETVFSPIICSICERKKKRSFWQKVLWNCHYQNTVLEFVIVMMVGVFFNKQSAFICVSTVLLCSPTFYVYIYLYLYLYVWKLNQTVLELDFWAVKFVFFPRRDLNSHHWYTAAPIA